MAAKVDACVMCVCRKTDKNTMVVQLPVPGGEAATLKGKSGERRRSV